VLAGATAPGVPFLIAGHNGEIAWAFTTTHGDTQDLFVERLSADRPGHYDSPDGPRPFETREETIRVRDGEPRRFTLRHSRHGPIVSDLSDGPEAGLAANQVMALAWPALRADDRTAEAVFAMSRARDWAGFRAALRDFHSPQQTLVFADRSGTIALAAPARVPLRPRGDGRAPVPGWTGEDDWLGFIPFDELPWAVNPPGGRLVTANNRVAPEAYPHLIAADWPSPHRARRIGELLDGLLLEGAGPADLDLQAAWQGDSLSLAAQRLLPLLLGTTAGSERGARALARLAAWDGRMARELPEPLIYVAWLWAANRALLADELGPDFGPFQRADADLLVQILSGDEAWCDDIGSAPRETCAGQLATSLEVALDHLEARFGDEMADWRWGRAHLARFRDQVLGRVPLLGGVFETRVETDGGQDTVNRGGPRLWGPAERLFENRHVPTFRGLYDLADLDASRFMIAGGQSGNPLSPYYGNLVEAWRDGRYVTLAGDEDAARHRLVLQPR
jgi:penicillin amidase